MRKIRLARVLATLAISGGALAALPAVGTATAPAAGVACQADGKINGRGATFARVAWDTFANGYQSDVCGPVPGGVAGNNMSVYNYAGSQTGSGQGQRSQICRSDAFGGSDIPYDNATKALFDGPAGVLGGLGGNCTVAIAPPYPPTGGTTVFPNAADQAAPIMSFPVAGASEVVGINLQNADCGGARPAAIQLTPAMITDLFQGDIPNWNDIRLRQGPGGTTVNAGLANCNVPVRRVVRSDRSGTTQIFKNYLRNIDPASVPTCNAAAATWTTLALDVNNTVWPTGGACVPLGTGNGNAGVVAGCADQTVPRGQVCYADLADISLPAGNPLLKASVRNATNTAFVAASVGTRANCNFGAVTTPGTGSAGAVGLDAGGDTWSFDNANGNRSDVTNTGAGYPICGLTFALVYSGLNDGAVANAIAGLNANQRRTLYSFITYVLSSAGQDRLNTARYTSLSAGLSATLRQGFQAGF